MVIREGSGPGAERGQWVVFHETVLTRSFVIARSTHFDGEPRRVLLGDEEPPPTTRRQPRPVASSRPR